MGKGFRFQRPKYLCMLREWSTGEREERVGELRHGTRGGDGPGAQVEGQGSRVMGGLSSLDNDRGGRGPGHHASITSFSSPAG